MDRPQSSRAERDTPSGRARVDVAAPLALLEPKPRQWLETLAAKALDLLHAAGEVRVRVVDDIEMASAHEEFAGVAGTTDVLTFDLAEPGSTDLDADILVCVDEAKRQAAARNHAPERELLLYIIHGVLHCRGHDDHDPEAATRMHAEEDRILSALGVGSTFAPEARR